MTIKMIKTQNCRHVAVAKCQCGDYLVSSGGGRFRSCPKCKGFIDQERWAGMWVRSSEGVKVLEHICPDTCECREDHKSNRQIKDWSDLKMYLMRKYKLRWNEETENYEPKEN